MNELFPFLCESMCDMGKKMKLLPWKVKQPWIFPYVTKKSREKNGAKP